MSARPSSSPTGVAPVPVRRASLHNVLRALYAGGWDGKSEPTTLTAGEALGLAGWRTTSPHAFPLVKGGPLPIGVHWFIWLANQTEDIEDRNLTAALAVVSHGFLRGRAGREPGCSPDAPPLNVAQGLTVLREVVDCLERKLQPSAATLEVWDEHDAGPSRVQRRAPSVEKRAEWARVARLARFAKWLKGQKRMSVASARHAELDASRMLLPLGLTPTTAQVDAWLSEQKQARRLRCAWKLYCQHCYETGERPSPGGASPGPAARPPISAMTMPPPEVCAAIKVLTVRFTFTGLHKLRVSDYLNDRGQRTIMVTTSRGRAAVQLSVEEHVAVQTVRAWAGNRGGGGAGAEEGGGGGGDVEGGVEEGGRCGRARRSISLNRLTPSYSSNPAAPAFSGLDRPAQLGS